MFHQLSLLLSLEGVHLLENVVTCYYL